MSTLPEFGQPPKLRPATRWWTVHEVEVLKAHFPLGGTRAVQARLPHRSVSAIYVVAKRYGIRYAGHGKRAPNYSYSPHIDDLIRQVYLSARRGAVAVLAKETGIPPYCLRRRALALGCVVSVRAQESWTPEELAILEDRATLTLTGIQRCLAQAGYRRTEHAIAVKRKRLGLPTKNIDVYSARGLAQCFGVDEKAVRRWIGRGLLRASRQGTRRIEAQGGDHFKILRHDVRRFIVEHVAHIDFRKLDRFWLVDLLTG